MTQLGYSATWIILISGGSLLLAEMEAAIVILRGGQKEAKIGTFTWLLSYSREERASTELFIDTTKQCLLCALLRQAHPQLSPLWS